MENKTEKLIHIGIIKNSTTGRNQFLFLRKFDFNNYKWFETNENYLETETVISGTTVGESINHAYRHWKNHSFRTLNCGFKYSLPERDEHGINALFYQMALSYDSSNGFFFDEEVGYNCFINFASQQALELWKQLKTANKL